MELFNKAWLNERTDLISEIKEKPACFRSRDGHCDSPGHCTKYMIYSILDQASNKVIDMEIRQCTQAGNSNRMEKFAFVKVLNRLKNENIKIEMLTTDRRSQIKKYMREDEKTIYHQLDV